MTKFFIDTADTNYIRDFCKLLPKEVIENQLLGITTNPAAFQKVGKLSLRDWLQRIRELSDLLTEISPDVMKELHVQLPNSKIEEDLANDFIDLVKLHVGPLAYPVIKIHPNLPVKPKGIALNITGLADGFMVRDLKRYNTPVNYLSIIPGRMDQVGIDSDAHLFVATQPQYECFINVIAGSMRTVEGLKRSIHYGCIPTIGTTVLDLIKNDLSVLNLEPSKEKVYIGETKGWNKCQMLSNKFFQQMDDAAAICYKDLINFTK